MKKVAKPPKVNKGISKSLTSAPAFKKTKSTGTMKLPKEITIDENIIIKTKFDKTQVKKGKNSREVNGQLPKAKKTKLGIQNKLAPPSSTPFIKAFTGPSLPKKTNKNNAEEVPLVSKLQKSKKVLPSKYVTDEVVTKAVSALQQLAQQQKKKNKMFEDEANVFAQIISIKIQSKKTTLRMYLPHSTVASTGEVCLITTDLKKGRKHDHEPSVDHWEETLRNAGVTQVKTVLPMRQLRVEYDQFELKRRLLTQHDFILVDSRIHSHVCHILGKVFFNKHNMLIPVHIHKAKDIKKNIHFALKSVVLHMSEGATSSVLVGHMGMTVKEIKQNILALVGQLAQKFPGGEHNIRSLSIKLPLSMALPLYITLRSKRTVHPPKIRSELPKQHRTVEGELSTISGKVKVTADGTVIVERHYETGMSDFENDSEEDVEESPKPKKSKKKVAPKEQSPPNSEQEDSADIAQDSQSENEEVSGSVQNAEDSDNEDVSGSDQDPEDSDNEDVSDENSGGDSDSE